MIKLNNIFLLIENLQQADKIYFNTGLLSNKVREIMINKITNGDGLTKKMCDLYYARLQQDIKDVVGNRNDDFSDAKRWENIKDCYIQLKHYNSNVFPMPDYDLKDKESVNEFMKCLIERKKILENFEELPSIAKRNMKSDIRQLRDYYNMKEYRNNLEYFMGYYSMLNNRSDDLKQNILRKMFKSDTNIDELLNFVEDKENLIGGADLTKNEIKRIIDEHQLDVIHSNGDYLIIKVDEFDAIKELGCNSLWCFTYNRSNGGANYQDWSAYSTNGVVYLFIDFSVPSDDNGFMHVLIHPLDFFPENPEEDNENKMYSMDNNEVYNPLDIVDTVMGLKKGRKLLNFDMDPQPKPKEVKPPKEKYKNPNQMELQFENKSMKKLSYIFENILKESEEIGFLAFHGSPTEFTEFSSEFAGADEAIDHDGPGIYFTTDSNDAARYGKNIYTVKLRGRFLDDSKPTTNVDRKLIEKLIKMAPDWKGHAQNWSENPNVGLKNAIEDFFRYNHNEKDVYLQVWIEFYRYSTSQYMKNMVALGFDGVVAAVDGYPNITHIIMYNPNAIKFIEKEVIGEELTNRNANTNGPEDDKFEVGMVKEGANDMIVAYHGRQSKYDSIGKLFDRIAVDGTDQEGAGVYFTTKADEAIKYASPNGFVYQVELHPKKLLSDKMGNDFGYLRKSIAKLIKTSPNWKRHAMGYDEDIEEGFDEMVYRYVSWGQSEKEVFVNLYHDVFKGTPKLFVKGMVKLGYDGLYLPAKDGGAHIVVYNPNIVKIIDIKPLS